MTEVSAHQTQAITDGGADLAYKFADSVTAFPQNLTDRNANELGYPDDFVAEHFHASSDSFTAGCNTLIVHEFAGLTDLGADPPNAGPTGFTHPTKESTAPTEILFELLAEPPAEATAVDYGFVADIVNQGTWPAQE